ncbi:MAG: ATP-binding protein [Candidatus Pacearchaeota archaeon]|nr:ATP-binding protein [Candidatus Pacearchaeota archaeon]
MERDKLYYVLFEQQKELEEKKDFIERELTKKALSFIHLKLPIIITGVRRSGKSTLLRIIKNKLNLKPKEYIYINFNDERLVDFSLEDFQKILDFAKEQNYTENYHLFLDEIQETIGWEKWVDRIKEKHQIFITGSNAKLLSKEISTVLTGRSISIDLYPFSFNEFLLSKKIKTDNWKLDLKTQSLLRKEFSEYLFSGGMPKAIIDKDKRLLKENYENILYRDIIKRFSQKLEKPIKEISVYLLSNAGCETSIRSLSKIIEIKNLSTLKTILDTFEKSFLFFFVYKFDYSVKKQIKNPRKIYCVDNGFVREGGFKMSDNLGRMIENLVFLELKRINKEIYYFSDKKECDFLIREKNKISAAIQVCYSLNEKNKDREINGLLETLNKFNLKNGLIITNSQEKEIKIEDKKIKVIPAWKWLLQSQSQ